MLVLAERHNEHGEGSTFVDQPPISVNVDVNIGAAKYTTGPGENVNMLADGNRMDEKHPVAYDGHSVESESDLKKLRALWEHRTWQAYVRNVEYCKVLFARCGPLNKTLFMPDRCFGKPNDEDELKKHLCCEAYWFMNKSKRRVATTEDVNTFASKILAGFDKLYDKAAQLHLRLGPTEFPTELSGPEEPSIDSEMLAWLAFWEVRTEKWGPSMALPSQPQLKEEMADTLLKILVRIVDDNIKQSSSFLQTFSHQLPRRNREPSKKNYFRPRSGVVPKNRKSPTRGHVEEKEHLCGLLD